MSQQLAYQTEITLNNTMPIAQQQATATTRYADTTATTVLAQCVRHGTRAQTPRSWSYWIGFLVGTVLTVGMLVWQSQRSKVVFIVQPIRLPITESLAITDTVGGMMPALVGVPAAGITDRRTSALSGPTGGYCPALPVQFTPPPPTVTAPPLESAAGVWHDYC